MTKMIIWAAAATLTAFGLAGCKSSDQYKAEADEQAYGIIDQKWDDNFGPKVNYKISDVEPDPNAIVIDPKLPLPNVLTLPQAVAIATANNRDYQSQKEALYASALDLQLERHTFENQYFGGGLLGYGKNAVSRTEAVSAEANFGFNRLLASGARFSTHVAISWADMLLGSGLRGGAYPILGISVIQPLLRGSDREVVLENLTQAERDTLYEIRAFNRYRKSFVVSVVTQYYQTLLLYDIAQNSKRNYQALAWVYRKTKTLAEAGRVPKYEADRAKQEALTAMDTYLDARENYLQAIDEYKIVLGIPMTTALALDEGELDKLRSAELKYPEFTEGDAVAAATERRLDLVNSADFVIDAQRKVRVAEDGLRAELNIGATISETRRPHGELYDLHPLGDQVDAALQLDLPLERESEKNIYRKALISLNERKREYELAKDTVALEIRQAYRDLTEASERYRIQLEAMKLAKKRFDDTNLMLKYGRASSRRVLGAQSDLYAAQNAASQALVGYTVAMLKFYRDSGVLRVKPDGMWMVNSPTQVSAK